MKNIRLEYSSYTADEWPIALCISWLQKLENTVVGSSYPCSPVLLAVLGIHPIFLLEPHLILKMNKKTAIQTKTHLKAQESRIFVVGHMHF